MEPFWLRIAGLVILSFLLTWLIKYLDIRSRLIDMILDDVTGWCVIMGFSAVVIFGLYKGLRFIFAGF